MKNHYRTVFHCLADKLLCELADAALILKHIDEDMAAELEALKNLSFSYQSLEENRRDNKEWEEMAKKELLALMQKHQADLFPDRTESGSDRVNLPHGALLHSLAEHIRKAKVITVDLLKKKGFPQAVKVVESVDWEEIAKLNDAQLLDLGTERKPQEGFEWELKTCLQKT